MDYPTQAEVMNATHEQLARWYRFLPTPGIKAPERLDKEQSIMELIMHRLNRLGGITPEVSKKVGWDKNAALKSILGMFF